MIDLTRIRRAARKPGLWGWTLAAVSMALLYAAGAVSRRVESRMPAMDDADPESDRNSDSDSGPVQPDAFSAAGVGTLGLALMIGVVVVAAGLWLGMERMAGGRFPLGNRAQVLPSAEDSLWLERYRKTGSGDAPFPLLQTDPAIDLARFRAREDSILNGWGWADRTAGKVRIPIELAMRHLAARGLILEFPKNGSPAAESGAAGTMPGIDGE